MYRIGVDVGGTNTDAAILDTNALESDSRGVLATCKTATTAHVTLGIQSAIKEVLAKSNVDRSKVLNVAIGTTHFVNAVVENDARRLSRVAVVRLCGPYTRKIPPFSDFPYALRNIIEGPIFYLDGGLEIDGREISSLKPDQIKEAASAIVAAGIQYVAVVGVFSALDQKCLHEERCKALLQQLEPSLSVACSGQIGGTGLLTRENATILNAAILGFARKTIMGFRLAMSKLDLSCPLYLTQNDGTLADATLAAELPVKTFASGPTNSLMGAAFLQRLGHGDRRLADKQVVVVDIGGTTTDICSLLPSGFPRQAPNFVEVGGVRTAFSMPEVLSIGLGGGSRVRVVGGDDGVVSVGPDSVAHRLTTDALIFGGSVLTATDVIVASGDARIGDSEKVKSVPRKVMEGAKSDIKRQLERAIDRMKVSSAPVSVLLVGGGSVILTDELDGVDECLRPPHHDSANAVGAAIAKVAGEIDIIEILAGRDENAAIEAAKKTAIDAAIANGADEKDVKIVDIQKIPLQYVNNKATRFVIKAVGSLKVKDGLSPDRSPNGTPSDEVEVDEDSSPEAAKAEGHNVKNGNLAKPTLGVDVASYRPDVRDGVWYISPVDVELIASGAGVLGTGGGGSPYLMALYTLDTLRKGGAGRMRVVALESLKDNDICVFGSGYGAPSVSNERIGDGTDVFAAIDAVNTIMGIKDFQGIVADEIGGGNGLVTFPTSARYDRPVVDCDLMGRAYPTLEHGTPYVYGQPVLPFATADCKGNSSVVLSAESNKRVEALIRQTCVEMGNSTAAAGRPLPGNVIKQYAVPNTVSQAWYLGRAVHLARQMKLDFIEAISTITPVRQLYTGKIIDVTRDVSRGYTVGRCIIAPLSVDEEVDIGPPPSSTSNGSQARETRYLAIPFQNEYLSAGFISPQTYHANPASSEEEEIICTVPDLISILGSDGEALGSPELRYGLKVRVIGMPAHPLWSGSAEALRVGGPEFFELKTEWKRVGEYSKPRSVIEEFDVVSS
ncbi:putative Hydantoinase/oxoprolinase [Cladophialophora carrionii]|uniref:Putative Hydantoinase/oxoprolinase n=1 Tax=Cladophialophora carrionii TaxID=86049 RepID=A0A1C1CKC5_9EURO|nr:putative Hydantoinase/oxoprolinase [Cladophialophora carrionii]